MEYINFLFLRETSYNSILISCSVCQFIEFLSALWDVWWVAAKFVSTICSSILFTYSCFFRKLILCSIFYVHVAFIMFMQLFFLFMQFFFIPCSFGLFMFILLFYVQVVFYVHIAFFVHVVFYEHRLFHVHVAILPSCSFFMFIFMFLVLTFYTSYHSLSFAKRNFYIHMEFRTLLKFLKKCSNFFYEYYCT